eukprot:COSAG02_NODE_8106_length_2707_cov_29.223806_3_plen_181_part_00
MAQRWRVAVTAAICSFSSPSGGGFGVRHLERRQPTFLLASLAWLQARPKDTAATWLSFGMHRLGSARYFLVHRFPTRSLHRHLTLATHGSSYRILLAWLSVVFTCARVCVIVMLILRFRSGKGARCEEPYAPYACRATSGPSDGSNIVPFTPFFMGSTSEHQCSQPWTCLSHRLIVAGGI